MFAVIKTGGKQYRVATDDVIRIERLIGEAGDTVSFDEVLMLGGDSDVQIGAPLLEGVSVAGEIVEQARNNKIIIFKKRRRQNSRRKNGHRQHVSLIRITEILTGGKKAAVKKAKPAAKKADAEVEAKEADAPKAAPKKAAAKKAAAPKADADAAAMFSAPTGDADDLKKISGVGPVLEKKLNALGITSFDQIAAFTAEDIAKVDEELNFKGRIERDGWLDQAKEFAAAK
ncbi:MAG: 50S ribosomal protein L21 [Hyphomicrobiales bacterium]|nr:MAG: 50S ribosomal protein L21 [Hyphomicrobiales bacterium]